MTFTSIWNDMFPVVVILAVGFSMARWFGLSAAPLATVLRVLFFPVVLYSQLASRMPLKTFATVAVIGAATSVLGWLLVKNISRFLALRIDMGAAVPNIATFLLPFLIMSHGSRGAGTACAFYIGAMIALHFIESRRDFGAFLREPWVYAVAIALLSQTLRVPSSVERILGPLSSAAYPLMLIFLGAYLHPFEGLKDTGAWATAGFRIAGGFLIGYLATIVFRLPSAVADGVMLAAMAPPATQALSLSVVGGSGSASKASASVGTLLFLVAIVVMMKTGWGPL